MVYIFMSLSYRGVLHERVIVICDLISLYIGQRYILRFILEVQEVSKDANYNIVLRVQKILFLIFFFEIDIQSSGTSRTIIYR